MAQLQRIKIIEILDSRGNPTVQVNLRLDQGTTAIARVPSGASTGGREAVELRDDESHRYLGRGVRTVAHNAEAELNNRLAGRPLQEPSDLAALDAELTTLDGTDRFAHLGANVAVGVSMAAARAIATLHKQPLWQLLHDVLNERVDRIGAAEHAPRLPVPHFNVINGGAHASNDLPFQEFMIAPLGAPSFADAVRAGAEIYHRLHAILIESGDPPGLGDEGGFAPRIDDPTVALDLLVRAIEAAGYTPGPNQIAIALDPAANGFHHEGGGYDLCGEHYEAGGLIDYYASLIERYPIWSVEDGLAEDDWDGWSLLTHRLGSRIQIVGDDIFCTNPQLIKRGIGNGTANAALIKVNQIGTVTQTLEAIAQCYRAGWRAMVSHRSGETDDTFIADLAVGAGCGQLKSGAPARGERTAKYNRLLEIAADESATATFAAWPPPVTRRAGRATRTA
ncbi:phosphopyruvate hydratase [Microlunatus elymi]